MIRLDFNSYPLSIGIAVFAVSAGVVWIAGTRVSRYADTISRQPGIGQAMIGLVLLGGITSLPEVAVTVTSSLGGNAELAVNNLLGGAGMQVAILAIADAWRLAAFQNTRLRPMTGGLAPVPSGMESLGLAVEAGSSATLSSGALFRRRPTLPCRASSRCRRATVEGRLVRERW